MKIKTKLLFIVFFSASAIIILSAFLYFSFWSFNFSVKKNKIANQIVYDVFENNLLLSEYLLYYEDRPRNVWFYKIDSQVALIKSQSIIFSKDSERKIINDLLEKIGKNQRIFLELIALREGSANSVEIETIKKEKQAQIATQILINNQGNVLSANQLATISLQDATAVQRAIEYFLVVFIVIVFFIVMATLSSIWLSIIKPLVILKDAVVRIAALDFTTTTTTTTTTDSYSNDEMGQLARAFDVMVKKLKESYENLSSSNQQLKASNQQLRASNQQLDATNQQLSVTNQQLALTEKGLREKMSELEVFNKVTVGRELKMMELKKEIEMLKNKKI